MLLRRLEHDAEKCARFSDDIMLLLFKLRTEFEIFRPKGPEIILFEAHAGCIRCCGPYAEAEPGTACRLLP
ncbi:hypothetical protein ELH27_03960 [Rhizobium leguminosarum]|uniref:Uncharacterized protein n=1 Tax=Rhizobium beringeri TaxID=3019934 RepID=A0ABY1XQR0_9HYPH|nr:hypothetical protein ELH27_03960 [Rhizobium leguminosarum]TBE69951.1 hypothetical protein ELH03_03840 [Rhizobium beringeri]